MSSPVPLRPTCIAASLGVGLLLLGVTPEYAPLERFDHAIAAQLTGTLPSSELHGSGSFEDPRERVRLAPPEEDPVPPDVVVVDDDPEGIFEAKPPSPSDQAVILANLLKRGTRHLAVTFPFGWEEPDPVSLTALRLQLDRFDSVVLGFPLAYGTGSEPVATPFLRLSVSEKRVIGGAARLPVVNRIAIPAPELGGGKSLAGFTRLLNEEETPGEVLLLARWNERVVFALPLAAEIARRGLDPADIRIEPGKSITLGEGGPWIAIDDRGRMKADASDAAPNEVPATQLIGGELPEAFASGPSTVFIRDRRMLVPDVEIEWANRVPGVHRAILRAPVPSAPETFSRPDALAELGALTGLAVLVGGFAGGIRRRTAFVLGFTLSAGIWFALQWMARGQSLLPLPLAFLAVPATAGTVRMFLGPVRKNDEPAELPEPAPAPEPVPKPPTPPPAPPDPKPEEVLLADPPSADKGPKESNGRPPVGKDARKSSRKGGKKKRR